MSFRSKSVFNTLLRNNLTSNLWNSIKDALLGSELIAYAAEFLYQQELLADGIVSSVYPSANSGLMNLLLCGNFNNVAFSYFRPATITIKLNGFDTTQFFEPFTIKLSKGNIVYTNIDWVSSDGSVTLYQGVPRVVSVNGGSINGGRFTQVSQQLNASVYRTSTDPDFYSYFINLESLPYTDSVYVYSKDTNGKWTTYQLYDSINADKDAKNYKLVWGTDLKLQLHFGNSLWGRNLQTSEQYYVYFLDCTFNQIDTSGLVLSVENSENSYLNGVTYDIVSYLEYSLAPDVSYKNLQNALNKTSVISTAEEIEEFVESFPLIKDSAVQKSSTAENVVVIYVRPEITEGGSSEEDIPLSYYNDITEALQAYGEIVTKYIIRQANAQKLQIVVTVLDYVNDMNTVTLTIKDYVSQKFENTSIGDSIDFSNLSNDIYSETGYRNIVRFYVSSEIVSNYQLNSLPVLNTMKCLHDRESDLNGNIENGVLFAKENFTSNQTANCVVFPYANILGNFVYASFTTPERSGATLQYIVVSKDTCKYTVSTAKFLFISPNILSQTQTERLSTNVGLTNYVDYKYGNHFNKIYSCSFNNYGYLSDNSDYNLFSPDPGALNLSESLVALHSDTNPNNSLMNYFSNGLPLYAGYDKKVFFLYKSSSVSSCTLGSFDMVSKSESSFVNFPTNYLTTMSNVKGAYLTDDTLMVFDKPTASTACAYLFNNYQNTLTLPTKVDFRISNTSDDTLTDKIMLSPSNGMSFGLNYASFVTAENTTLNQGRCGVLVIDVNEHGNFPQNFEVEVVNGYVMLVFNCLGNVSESLNLYLYQNATVTQDETSYQIYSKSATTSDLVSYIYLKFTNLSTTQTLYIGDGVNNRAPIEFTPSTATFSLNVSTLPKLNDGVVTSELIDTFPLTALFNSIPSSADNAMQIIQSVGALNFNMLSADNENEEYYFVVDAPYYRTLASNFVVNGVTINKCTESYTTIMKLLVRCYTDNGTKKAEFLTDLSLLKKVGAFDSTGKLTMFDNTNISGLRVSYETQNTYFAVDNTSYAELDGEGVFVNYTK